MRKAAKRMVSLLAALALVFSLGAPVLAEGAENEPQPCPAHTEHDSECGYVEGVEAGPCAHGHDAACGYVEAAAEQPCTFVHEHITEGENACGYDAETGEGCTYDPASHTHDDACGFVAAVEGQPCTHAHSAECGYAETVEAAPCAHSCEVCAAPMMAPATLNGVAPMALPLPANGLGEPWDGVDFTTLTGSGIYFGQYAHATDLSGGTEAAAPVLWRVMGEEGNDGNLTLLSEYVLDSSQFNGSSNVYEGSTIQSKLAAIYGGGMFETWESPLVMQTDVTTGMYTNSTENELTGTHQGTPYPVASNGQYLYLPWGTHTSAGNNVFWTAGNDIQAQYTIYRNSTGTENIATLRGGGSVTWWLRSPGSASFSNAMAMAPLGSVGQGSVNNLLGIRPAFKLNPESVIFTSEIATSPGVGQTQADNTNYFADAGGVTQIYKLTVLDTTLSLNGLQADGQTVDAGTHPTITHTAQGGTVAVTGTGTAGTLLTYKIVDNATRAIVGYGQGANNTSLTVNAKGLDGTTDLADGSYTVYVWAQKDNALNSHGGSTPQYFTLNVDAPPTVVTVAPSGSSEATSGSVKIVFSETMDTTAGVGSIALNSGTPLAAGTWSTTTNTNDTYTAPYSGLAYGTAHTVNISGFKDAAGHQMAADSTHSFTTQANSPPTRKSGVPATATDTVTANTAYMLNLSNIFEDTDSDPLTYSVQINGAAAVAAAQSYSYTPTATGTVTLVFRANDSTADSSDTYTVTLSVNPAAPAASLTVGTMPNDTAVEGEQYSKTVPTTYTGSGTLTYSTASALPTGLTLNTTTGVLSGTLAASTAGSYPITVTVTDGTLNTSGSYTLTVTAAVQASVLEITDPADVTVKVGQSLSVTPGVTYTGSGTLAYSATGLPAGVGINAATGEISGKPTAKGDYAATITVTDQTLTDTASFTIHVTAESTGGDDSSSSTPTSGSTDSTTSGSPQTGDSSNMGVWVTLMVASLVALGAGVWLYIRRHKKILDK